jgi:hypothetical protein
MNQNKSMVTLALMAAHEISFRNGVAFVVSVLVAGWVIAAIRASLFGHQYFNITVAGVAANAQLLCGAA